MEIQVPLVCFLLLAAQFGYAQEKARSLEDYFRRAKELETREHYSGAEKKGSGLPQICRTPA